MSGDDRRGEEKRPKPPSRTGRTIQGMPSGAPPAPEPPPDDADAMDSADSRNPWDRNRVTMDFSGPPLSLPGEPDDAAEPERTAWAAEMDDVGGRDSSVGIDERPHDAWTVDRRRRSTPPVGMPAAVVEPPSGPLPPMPQPTGEHRSWSVPPSLPSEPEGGALGLVDRARRSSSQQYLDLASEMAERYALDDFSGALRTAELLLGTDPSNQDAQRYAEACRQRLVQFYSSRLGPMTQRVEVIVPDHEVRWLGLDHRAGFLLSRIDGEHTIEEVIDMSGMQPLEALKTLVDLREAGAIRIAPA